MGPKIQGTKGQGRYKTIEVEEQERVAYNFLTSRYVSWKTIIHDPQHYYRNPQTNVVLDLVKVGTLSLDDSYYISIFTHTWYPTERIQNPEHEGYLGIEWDSFVDRYFPNYRLPRHTERDACNRHSFVWYEPGQRYVPRLPLEYRLELGIVADVSLPLYRIPTQEEYIQFAVENKRISPTPSQKYQIAARQHTVWFPWTDKELSLIRPILVTEFIPQNKVLNSILNRKWLAKEELESLENNPTTPPEILRKAEHKWKRCKQEEIELRELHLEERDQRKNFLIVETDNLEAADHRDPQDLPPLEGDSFDEKSSSSDEIEPASDEQDTEPPEPILDDHPIPEDVTSEGEDELEIEPIMAGVQERISARDIPTFSGNTGESAVEHKNAMFALYRLYGLYPQAGAAQADAVRLAVRIFISSLRGKALTWYTDHIADRDINTLPAWNTLWQEFVREFHPLGKTQLEWDVAWNSLSRSQYNSLLEYSEKLLEIGRLLGKENAAILDKIKLHAEPIESLTIGEAANPDQAIQRLKEFAARNRMNAPKPIGAGTSQAKFMALSDEPTTVALLQGLTESVQTLNAKYDQLAATFENRGRSQYRNQGNSPGRPWNRSQSRERRQNGASYRHRSQSRDRYSSQRDDRSQSRGRYPSTNRDRYDSRGYSPSRNNSPFRGRVPRRNDYDSRRREYSRGRSREREQSQNRDFSWRCEVCQGRHPTWDCRIREQVLYVENKQSKPQDSWNKQRGNYNRYKNNNNRRSNTPRPDAVDKLTALLEANLQAYEDVPSNC